MGIMSHISDIFAKDLECLLEASDKLRHVPKEFVLMVKPIIALTFKIGQEPISFVLSVEFELVQELVC